MAATEKYTCIQSVVECVATMFWVHGFTVFNMYQVFSICFMADEDTTQTRCFGASQAIT